MNHPKLKQIVVDFKNLQSVPAALRADVAFCTLGTTIAQAGSREAFRQVDFVYVQNFAKLGQALGAQKFLMVSAVGTNAQSRAFYLRVKGEAEQAVEAEGYAATHFFRPSIIAARGRDFRWNERLGLAVAKLLNPLWTGRWARYRPTEAQTIARALWKAADDPSDGVHVYYADEMKKIAR